MDDSDLLLNHKLNSKEVIDLTKEEEEEEEEDNSICVIDKTTIQPIHKNDLEKNNLAFVEDQRNVESLITANSEPLSLVKTSTIPISSRGNSVSLSADTENVIDLSGESTSAYEKSPSSDLLCEGRINYSGVDRERGNTY